MKRIHGRRMKRMESNKELEKDAFFHEMFHRNCAEREAYNETLYTYEEYVEKNRQFLEDQWKKKEAL